MRNLTVGLSLALILLMGAAPAFAGDPRGPGAPNNAPMTASGTWQDMKLVFFTDSVVGVSTSITSEICGTISGTLTGTYCDYRNLVVNQATGIGTFSSLDVCSCNPMQGVKHPAIISREIGTVSFLPPVTEKIGYQAVIQVSFGSTITNGTLNFSGSINPLTLLANGTYFGTVN